MKNKNPTQSAVQAIAKECNCSESDAGYFLTLVAEGFDAKDAALRAGLDAAPKNKRGRPTLPSSDKLEVVPVRLTEAQKAKLKHIGVQRLRDWLDRVKAA